MSDGRWDKSTKSRTKFWFKMLIVGAILVWTATLFQLAIYFVYHQSFALSEAVGEGTLAVMLVWAAFFMRKVEDYGSPR